MIYLNYFENYQKFVLKRKLIYYKYIVSKVIGFIL